MSGGKQDLARSRWARPLASGLIGGLLISPWSAGVDLLRAAEIDDAAVAPAGAIEASPAGSNRLGEKSIVIQSGKAAEALDADVVVSDQTSEDALEPIATTTDAAPDLADPPAGSPGALEPTLADEYVDLAKPGTTPPVAAAEDAPTADDVCVEEELPVNDKPTPTTLQVASFNGATPGVTTRAELIRLWGEPVAEGGDGETLVYEPTGFPSVAVELEADVVSSLRVQLNAPVRVERLVEKLGLANLRPAIETNERGSTIATTFPDRGVTLNHASAAFAALATDAAAAAAPSDSGRVDEIVIRKIEAAPFLLRAETAPARAYTDRIADLETALRLDPKNARARWLLSQVRLAVGSAAAAESLAREAVDLEPRNDEYRLQWAKCLKYLARYDQAVEQTRLVLEGATAAPLVRAEALDQMGLLAALGSPAVQERAIPLHNKAIELADSLAASENPAERARASQLLVAAHLAVAQRIAVGDWDDKQDYVAQWISRASALTEQMIESGEGDVSLRLQVASCALVAGARLSPPIDPKLWIAEAEHAAAEIQQGCDDPLARAEIDWQLGLAYLYATEMSHRRSEADEALQYGALAESKLAAGSMSRRELPDGEFVLGRLYFQIGAVHAVHKGDHAAACKWYDRAIDPLSQPVPVTALAAPGLHGDALVSMAVSYWEIGDRERAYELTGAGVELVEQGIAEGLLTEESLQIPKSNFVAMSRALGKIELATPNDQTGESKQSVAQQDQTPAKRTSRGAPNRPASRVASRRNSGGIDVRRR